MRLKLELLINMQIPKTPCNRSERLEGRKQQQKKCIPLERLEVKVLDRSNPTLVLLPAPTLLQGEALDLFCHLMHSTEMHKNQQISSAKNCNIPLVNTAYQLTV